MRRCMPALVCGFLAASFLLPAASREQREETPWPRDHRATLRFTLVDSTTNDASQKGKKKKFKRHYTAVWIENGEGDFVKLLALWAKRKELKHVKDLDAFWDAWSPDRNLSDLNAVARPSRNPGEYTLHWDGTDMEGNPVSAGTYSLNIDINREDGPPGGRERHTHSAVELPCEKEPTEESAEDRPELQNVSASFGPNP